MWRCPRTSPGSFSVPSSSSWRRRAWEFCAISNHQGTLFRFEDGMTLEGLYALVRSGGRLTPEEGLFVLRNAELLDLGDLANQIRFKKNPELQVTFIVDTNPNYTNVC